MLAQIIRWGSPVTDSAQAWADAVRRAGGSVSANRLAVVRTFVAAERASGAWDLTDDYWVLWAENATQALTSLKQRRLATAVNTPTFTADRQYTFDGATNYINTGFIPGMHGLVMSATSVHLEVYERTDVNANNVSVGVNSTVNRGLVVRPRTGSNALLLSNSASATYTLPASTSLRLTQAGRAGSLPTDAYGAKDGVSMARTVDAAAVGASLPVDALFIGCTNTSGTPGSFRAASIGFVSIGAALSGAQRLARSNAVQACATSVGANV